MSSMPAEPKIDEETAAEMVGAKATVRDLAQHFGVSTQAIYIAIRKGRIPAPANARLGDSAALAADSTTPQPAAK